MYDRLLVWWTFFQISINERLVYRGDFMLGTLMRFLPTLTQIFLWWAIFDVVSDPDTVAAGQRPDGRIAGFGYGDMIAYFLLVTVGRAFSSMPGLTTGIANQVRSGEVKKFLIQPVDMLGCLLIQRVAHKLVYYLIATLPFALVFYLCRGFFENGWPDMEVMLVFLASLLLGFLLGYFLESCIGLISFWFLEVTSLTFFYMLLNFFLSGHMFPLSMLPDSVEIPGLMTVDVRQMVELLPFQYLAYFPAAVFLGKVDGPEMYRGLAMELAWVLFFILLARVLWWRGVRRYSGYGG